MRRTKIKAAETKEMIIDAAEEAFIEQGISFTSLSDIARRAGVTRGAIYFHFKNKNDLIRDMISRIRFPEEELIEEAEKNDLIDPLDILENSCLVCFNRLTDDPRQQRVVTIVSRRRDFIGDIEEMDKRLQQAHDNMLDLFTRMFKMAKNRNMLSPEWQPQNSARAVVSTMRGLITEWLENNNDFDLNQLGSQTMHMLINSMRIEAKQFQASAANH